MSGARFSDAQKTRWTLVRHLDHADERTEREAAWVHLQGRYRSAMVGYARAILHRRGGKSAGAQDAEDVVQGFLSACWEKQWLTRANPELGQFRTFVRVLLRRFTVHYIEKMNAGIRTPKDGVLTAIDPLRELLPDSDDGEMGAAFDEEWSACMVEGAMERVRERSDRNAQILAVLREAGGSEVDPLEYLGVAPGQRHVARFRARKMLAESIWEELKQTVTDDDALEAERKTLFPYLEQYLPEDVFPSFHGKRPPTR